MEMDELRHLLAECAGVATTLRGITGEDWHRPALGEWDVHVLAAHLQGTLARAVEYADAPPAAGPATTDRVRYYRYDVDEVAPGVAQRASERAAVLPPEQVPAAVEVLAGELRRRLVDEDPDRLLATPFGTLPLADYLATRCVEAVVHHMDLRRALDLPLAADPGAADLVAGLLDAMLDGPRPAGLDRDGFILAATGRVPTDDPRLPLLG
jgi:uncharacterized protein (TIGR03083 family)